MSEAGRVFKIIREALRKAGVDQRDATSVPLETSGTSVYWREVGELGEFDAYLPESSDEYGYDIEIVFDSAFLPGERLHTSVRLYRLALEVVWHIQNRADAVNALSDVLKYLRDTVAGILPDVHQGLEERKRNTLLRRLPEFRSDRVVRGLVKAVVEPQRKARDDKSKERKTQFRNSLKQGERGKDRRPRARASRVPAHERIRRKVILTLIHIRSLPEEERLRESVNSKKELARRTGIHPATLRRAERDGEWEVEELQRTTLQDLKAMLGRARKK